MEKKEIEMETKDIKEMCEKVVALVKMQFAQGLENVETVELGQAIDMIRDLTEAKKNMAKFCYYVRLIEAMEKADYGDDYDEEGPIRNYGGQRRSSTTGRFMRGYDEQPMERFRDQKMYYENGSNGGGYSRGYSDGMRDGMQRDYREGNSGNSRRMYEEKKEMHKTDNPMDKKERISALEKYLKDLEGDIREMLMDASPEEKNKARQSLASTMSSI